MTGDWQWVGEEVDRPHHPNGQDGPAWAPSAVPLSSISTDPPPPMLLDRLDPEGHTILYGTGGIGKGALASYWITRLVEAGHRVLILDYESHPGEWARRIGSLDPDASAGVWYTTPTEPLHTAADGLSYEIGALGITYVVIDSAVMACGDDPMKPEAARSYGAGLVALGRPALSLAHVTKIDDARYPFGSVFWHNLARTTWSLTPDGDARPPLLTHRKNNNYARLSPQSVVMTWTDNRLLEVTERAHVATIGDDIATLLELNPDGLYVKEIVAAMRADDRKVSDWSVQSALRRSTGPKGRFTCTNVKGKIRWGMRA